MCDRLAWNGMMSHKWLLQCYKRHPVAWHMRVSIPDLRGSRHIEVLSASHALTPLHSRDNVFPAFHSVCPGRPPLQGRKKINLVQLFTEMNLTVIISDTDTVWMRNPFEYFKQYPEADILTSSDFLHYTHGDEGLEEPRDALSPFNIGIMMFSPKSASFARKWVEVIEADEKYWDQHAFNECAPSAWSSGKAQLVLTGNADLLSN